MLCPDCPHWTCYSCPLCVVCPGCPSQLRPPVCSPVILPVCAGNWFPLQSALAWCWRPLLGQLAVHSPGREIPHQETERQRHFDVPCWASKQTPSARPKRSGHMGQRRPLAAQGLGQGAGMSCPQQACTFLQEAGSMGSVSYSSHPLGVAGAWQVSPTGPVPRRLQCWSLA